MTNAMEIYQMLPKTNCKKCGKTSCMAFAVALMARELTPEDCPPLKEEPKYKESYEKISGLFKPSEGATETGLIVHEDLCFGCGNCVVACPPNVANDPYGVGSGNAPRNANKLVLVVEDGIVKAQNLGECRRFGKNKILCNGCIVTCPVEAIEFV
ncbi:Tungsten-containing formylmethanofuran dehydrogenase 2 subunit G [Methanosarcina horonobensis HB-1 = JCM 15518]|uniref:Tungsten-containing formylmethanofuran dehydrogenase 2 subunit G n=1 Tax=Methanosarcina horonobensis HB-1 = JCM 15518 TaxID=1434110 RepID=A0A0E3WVI3_9EURY|nr:(Fe-S)-binding protein [Methanosarcina horonobensis]AKB77900.1 Tungsten-containing formylmethanofuran dehydrogenase 2 subunit G [Methanosarcina horonobensis HB-1 = JCM 15518]